MDTSQVAGGDEWGVEKEVRLSLWWRHENNHIALSPLEDVYLGCSGISGWGYTWENEGTRARMFQGESPKESEKQTEFTLYSIIWSFTQYPSMFICFSEKPLAHWLESLFPFIAKLLKRMYIIVTSNSSLSFLSWIHFCQAFIPTMPPISSRWTVVTATLVNLMVCPLPHLMWPITNIWPSWSLSSPWSTCFT